MKLSTAFLIAASVFASSEAAELRRSDTVEAKDAEGRELFRWGWWNYNNNDELVGDCSALSGQSFTAHTGFDLNENILVTYPCSGGYLRNFAPNGNLLDDVRDAINQAGRALGIDADCANLCDIDNGSYATPSSTGFGSVATLRNGDVFCGDDGVLRTPEAASVGFDPADPCRCDPDNGYIAGCKHCSGEVTFSVKTCLDSSNSGR